MQKFRIEARPPAAAWSSALPWNGNSIKKCNREKASGKFHTQSHYEETFFWIWFYSQTNRKASRLLAVRMERKLPNGKKINIKNVEKQKGYSAGGRQPAFWQGRWIPALPQGKCQACLLFPLFCTYFLLYLLFRLTAFSGKRNFPVICFI